MNYLGLLCSKMKMIRTKRWKFSNAEIHLWGHKWPFRYWSNCFSRSEEYHCCLQHQSKSPISYRIKLMQILTKLRMSHQSMTHILIIISRSGLARLKMINLSLTAYLGSFEVIPKKYCEPPFLWSQYWSTKEAYDDDEICLQGRGFAHCYPEIFQSCQ